MFAESAAWNRPIRFAGGVGRGNLDVFSVFRLSLPQAFVKAG